MCITFKLLQNLGAENNKHLSSYSFLWVRQVGVAYLGGLAQSLLQGCNQGSTRAVVTQGSTGEDPLLSCLTLAPMTWQQVFPRPSEPQRVSVPKMEAEVFNLRSTITSAMLHPLVAIDQDQPTLKGRDYEF